MSKVSLASTLPLTVLCEYFNIRFRGSNLDKFHVFVILVDQCGH